jgi:hypothetical protein
MLCGASEVTAVVVAEEDPSGTGERDRKFRSKDVSHSLAEATSDWKPISVIIEWHEKTGCTHLQILLQPEFSRLDKARRHIGHQFLPGQLGDLPPDLLEQCVIPRSDGPLFDCPVKFPKLVVPPRHDPRDPDTPILADLLHLDCVPHDLLPFPFLGGDHRTWDVNFCSSGDKPVFFLLLLKLCFLEYCCPLLPSH